MASQGIPIAVKIDGYGTNGLSPTGDQALHRAGFDLMAPGWKPKYGEAGAFARNQFFKVAIGNAENHDDAVAKVKWALGAEAYLFCIH